jgi:hypothetical protein
MSEAHKRYPVRSKRLTALSSDVHNHRKGRSAIVNQDQRFLAAEIDRWINEGGALSPWEITSRTRASDGAALQLAPT